MSTCRRAPAQPNQSLVNGLDCLLSLASSPEPVGGRELARALDMEPTRVNRLLGTLAYLGLAQQTADRKYYAGPGLHVLAAMSLRGSRLLGVSLPHLRDLSLRLEKGVSLGVLWRRHVCYLFHGMGNDLAAAVAGQDLYPAEDSSIGRVLLAALGPETVRARYDEGMTGATSISELISGLPLWQSRGWAEGVGHAPSLAVPIGNPPVAAIAVVGGSKDTERRLLIDLLKETAAKITEELV